MFPSQIDLNHLVVFSKIVESGSLTKAAHLLGQPKSRVSRILSALERDLNVQLIHRTTRHLKITDIGKRFYEHCKGPLVGLEEATRDLANCLEEVQGSIKMTASQDFGNAVLPAILDEFTRLYPKIVFEVVLAQEFVNLVQESVDIAVRIGPLKDSQLKARKVAEIRLVVVASPTFIESHSPMNQLGDLLSAPLFCLESTRSRGWTFTNGKEKRTLKIDPCIVANDPDFLLKMILRDRGVALLPDFLCKDHFKSGRLVPLFRSWRSEPVPISLVYPYQKQLPSHVRRFADFLETKLKAVFDNVD